MKIIVKISEEKGEKSYTEDVTVIEREYWKEISTNGANSYFNGKNFSWWTRPIKCTADNIDQFNTRDDNAHFIFGWMEAFAQGHNLQTWMYDSDVLIIEVLNEEDKIHQTKSEHHGKRKRIRRN